MFCNKCGKELDEDARFCTFCGAKIPEVTQESEPAIDEHEVSHPTSTAGSDVSTRRVVALVACVLVALVSVVAAFCVVSAKSCDGQSLRIHIAAPHLDDAGTRVPVVAKSLSAPGTEPVRTFVSGESGGGLALGPGSYELSIECSPFASDGTFYKVDNAVTRVEVADGQQASANLSLDPIDPCLVSDMAIERAASTAREDGERSGKWGAPSIDEVVRKAQEGAVSRALDVVLAKAKWAQEETWSIDGSLEGLPVGGYLRHPLRVTDSDKIVRLKYALCDIDGDSFDELVFAPDEGNDPNTFMCAYKVYDGKPVCVATSPAYYGGASDKYCILKDGHVAIVKTGNPGSTITTFKVVRDGLMGESTYTSVDGACTKDGAQISTQEFNEAVGNDQIVRLDYKKLDEFTFDCTCTTKSLSENEALRKRVDKVHAALDLVCGPAVLKDETLMRHRTKDEVASYKGFIDESKIGYVHQMLSTGTWTYDTLHDVGRLSGLIGASSIEVQPISTCSFKASVKGKYATEDIRDGKSGLRDDYSFEALVLVDPGSDKIVDAVFLSDTGRPY